MAGISAFFAILVKMLSDHPDPPSFPHQERGMIWWVMLFVSLGVTFIGFVYSNRALKKEKQQERAIRIQDQLDVEARQRQEREVERQDYLGTKAREREDWLNESITCESCSVAGAQLALTGIKRLSRPPATRPRRHLWRLPANHGGKAVCSDCFARQTGALPVRGKDKPAFE
jgi:hypothetical protein